MGGRKVIAKNRRASFDYELLERFEAGLVLTGSEVKSLRLGRASLQEGYARATKGEFFIHNLDISPYEFAGPNGHEPKRTRKLLLKREEIRKLLGKTQERGLTLVPTLLYFKDGRAKLEIALARGRQKGDKREKLKSKEADRDMRSRTMKR